MPKPTRLEIKPYGSRNTTSKKWPVGLIIAVLLTVMILSGIGWIIYNYQSEYVPKIETTTIKLNFNN